MGGIDFAWTLEGRVADELVRQLRQGRADARKLAGCMVCPNELFEDADQLTAFLTEAIPAGLVYRRGAGVYLRFGCRASRRAFSMRRADRGRPADPSEVTFTDLTKMIERMLPRA